MDILTTPRAMMDWADTCRAEGLTVGLVPTMGYLHAGHASLMDLLRPQCDRLVVSIFVNPLQFGAGEDLDTYPRDEAGDRATCEAHGVDAVFLPARMYPEGFSTHVEVAGLTDGLCGAKRPGHFQGVTTVVSRLFGLTRCDVAAFGEKDYQQLAVIRRMVRDLAMPVRVVGGAIVRDADGLALSSRNTYLSDADRTRGLSLHRALGAMAEAATAGETDVAALTARAREILTVDQVDYLEVVDALTLAPLERVDRPARALVAAFVGGTRLIDNAPVNPPS